jgi:mannitol/fructose-specific phosphotransferase system IIA component
VKKDNKTLKAENEALMLKLVRVEKEKAAALQKLEKRLARKEKLERLEAAESLEEKERIRTATIQVRQ